MTWYRRSPTKVQWVMIAFMGTAFGALVAWLVPEMAGVFSPELEDTYSEWVFDAPGPIFWFINLMHLVIGIAAIGSVWHFIENRILRRQREKEWLESQQEWEESQEEMLASQPWEDAEGEDMDVEW